MASRFAILWGRLRHFQPLAGTRRRVEVSPAHAAFAGRRGRHQQSRICQAHLAAQLRASGSHQSQFLLSQLLGPVFLDVEKYAAHWQRARGSQPIANSDSRRLPLA